MRAYVITRYGGPEAMALRDVATPVPGPGHVLIKVRAAGLNPVDYKMRQGKLRPLFRPRLPFIAGCELAGTVVGLGSATNRFRAGDRVYSRVDAPGLGAFAEFVCVPQELVALMPQSLEFVEAAGLPLAGLTALQSLRDELRIQPGSRLFISGGAGGVGTLAIQLAKYYGAEVTTTASPRGHALVRELGADHVVDYTRENFAHALKDFDAALDAVGGRTLKGAFRILRRGAAVVSVAGIPEPKTALQDLHASRAVAALFWVISLGVRLRAWRSGVSYRYLFMHASGDDLRFLAGLVDTGKIRPVVDSVYPLTRISDAFSALETGHAKGKIIVTMDDDSPA
ncbi:NADP-dependent oxidoreductase [Arthrobacter sp. R4-81]